MNQKIKAEWLQRLRDYSKPIGNVLRRSDGRMCVMGMLCDLYVEKFPDKAQWEDRGDGTMIIGSMVPSRSAWIAPVQILQWAGLPAAHGKHIDQVEELVDHNDCGWTKEELIDWIEVNL